jgi:hypothetical protein
VILCAGAGIGYATLMKRAVLVVCSTLCGCSLLANFDGFTRDGQRLDGGAAAAADAGADTGLAPGPSRSCDASNTYCDGFERTAFLDFPWSDFTVQSGGSVQTILGSTPPAPEGTRAAEFVIAPRDGGGISSAYLAFERPARELYFRAQVLLPKRPPAGDIARLLTIESRNAKDQATSYLVVETSQVRTLFSQIPISAAGTELPRVLGTVGKPWPIDAWSTLEVQMDLVARKATLRCNGDVTALDLLQVGAGTQFVLPGIQTYEPLAHGAFTVRMDAVLMQVVPP